MIKFVTDNGAMFSGVWCLVLGFLTMWAIKFMTTSLAFTRYLRIWFGIAYGSLALGCFVFALSGRKWVVALTVGISVVAVCVLIPTAAIALVKYPRKTEVLWTLKAILARRRNR